MENEKAERLRIMLEEALKPLTERLDRIEKELQELQSLYKNQ